MATTAAENGIKGIQDVPVKNASTEIKVANNMGFSTKSFWFKASDNKVIPNSPADITPVWPSGANGQNSIPSTEAITKMTIADDDLLNFRPVKASDNIAAIGSQAINMNVILKCVSADKRPGFELPPNDPINPAAAK
jgi:hypothetical protein